MKNRFIIVTMLSILMVISGIFNNQVSAMGIGIEPEPINNTPQLFINEEEILFGHYAEEPVVIDGITMLPVRAIAENLGFDVKWMSDEKSVIITKDNFTVQFFIDEDYYVNNTGQTLKLGIQPIVKNGRTLLPSDFFVKVLGAEVVIDGNKTKINGHINWQDEIVDTVTYHSIVADVPTNYMEDNFYEYSFDIVDSPIEGMGKAIRIIGNNHSDDMFMGFYKKIDGLKPNSEYIFKFSMDLGTNISGGMMGVGGSPGSSVWVKAGIIQFKPEVAVENGYYRISNFDKSNQSESGTDLKVVTNMEKPAGDYTESFSNKTTMHHFIAETNSDGEVFLVVGTDSGFEATTEVYYDNLKLSYKEATPYNLSVVQESYYTIETEYIKLDNGSIIGMPVAKNFINIKNEAVVNTIIKTEMDALKSRYTLTRLNNNYTVHGDLLSIILTGAYETDGDSFNFYKCINIDMSNYKLIKTENFVKQDDVSQTIFNEVFKNKLINQGVNSDISFNNSMNIFYESGMYLISFLEKDTDTSDTLIYFSEDELKDLLNY